MKQAFFALVVLAACQQDAPPPQPVTMTEASTGYFCQMDIIGHPGPKAQVHLAAYPGAPLFFSQVRDAVAYLRLPEHSGIVTATYVSDMGAAASWADPGATNWIAADKAQYVVGSDAKGGMDAPELVPFGDPAKAQDFVVQHGGQVMGWAQIPASALSTGPINPDLATNPDLGAAADFAARLRALSPTGG